MAEQVLALWQASVSRRINSVTDAAASPTIAFALVDVFTRAPLAGNPLAVVPEDPATGTAAGPLACYLRHYGAFNGERARFAQGVETGRPSELEIELRGDEVVLRGEAVVAAAGTLQLPAS